MKLYNIQEKIYMAYYDTAQEAARSLIRFQEFYDNEVFRDKVGFTIKEYREWYKRKWKSRFDYYSSIVGFNIPAFIFEYFIEGDFGRLTKREQEVIRKVKKTKPAYVIGISKQNKSAIKHEIAHALYGTKTRYRMAAEKIILKYNTEKIHRWLKKDFHIEETIADEIHAYIMDDLDHLKEEDIYREEYIDAQKELRELYNRNVKKKRYKWQKMQEEEEK